MDTINEKNARKVVERAFCRRVCNDWFRGRKATFKKGSRDTQKGEWIADERTEWHDWKVYWNIIRNPKFFWKKGIFQRLWICDIFSFWSKKFWQGIKSIAVLYEKSLTEWSFRQRFSSIFFDLSVAFLFYMLYNRMAWWLCFGLRYLKIRFFVRFI